MLLVTYTMQHKLVEYLINDQFERMWKGMFVACVKVLPCIHLYGLKKTTNNDNCTRYKSEVFLL